jgi:hypothetical protein
MSYLVLRSVQDALGAETFDYYIGPSGSDSNDGSIGSPKAITFLNNAAIAGLRIGLLDGTYDLLTTVGTYPSEFNQHILDCAAGSAIAQTVVKSVNEHGAILNARFPDVTQDPWPEAAVIGCSTGGYVTIQGLKIINAGYRAIMVASGSGYQIRRNWIVDQLYDDPAGPVGANSSSINLLTGVSGAVVSGNRVEGSGAPSDNNRHAMIQTFDTVDSVIELNTLIGGTYGGNGIHYKNAGNKRLITRLNFIDMTITGPFTTGVLYHGNVDTDGEELVEQNVIKAGSAVYSEGAANRFKVINNTFYFNGEIHTVGWYFGGLTLSGGLDFYNNITYRTGAIYHGDMRIQSVATTNISAYNLWTDNSPDTLLSVNNIDTGYSGLAAFYAATGFEDPTKSVTAASPGFVGSGSEAAYFVLDVGSAGIGTGKSNGTSGGSSVDMGAWGGLTPPNQIGAEAA